MKDEETPLIGSVHDKIQSISIAGKLYLVAATSILALTMVATKSLYAQGMPASQVNFWISFWLIINSSVMIRIQKISFLPDERSFMELCIYSIIFTTCNVLWLFSVFFADAGNCASFIGVVPLVTAFLSYFLLSESIPGAKFLTAAITSLVGVIMVVQPPFLFADSVTSLRSLFGYLLMMGAVISYGGFAIYQRAYPTHPTRSVFYAGFFMSLSYFFISFFDDTWASASSFQFCLIFGISLMKTVAYLSITKGCALCTPTTTSLLFLLEIPSTYVLETLILDAVLNYMTYIGVVLILGSVSFYIVYTAKSS